MPIPSLPAEIKELMTVPVTWEKALGQDGYGQQSYAPALTLKCWAEEYGFSSGGMIGARKGAATDVDPKYSLYFPGDDSNARAFSMYDRFTVSVVFGDDKPLQPSVINTIHGPNFDNKNPWLIQVAF